MARKFSGKSILVTGGAKRIGRAIAQAFARRGASVIVHCRNSEAEARELVNELSQHGGGHGIVQADLAVPEERAGVIPAAFAINGRLDILVNNASVYRRCELRETSEEDARRDMEINFFAPFMLMQDFAHHCGEGSIVNLLDQRIANIDPAAGMYALAKKSLRDATEAAAVEWAPAIRVNGVAPGIVLPPPGVDEEKMIPLLNDVPMRERTTPEEIAEACIFLAASETITGNIVYADGGLHLAAHGAREKSRGQ